MKINNSFSFLFIYFVNSAAQQVYQRLKVEVCTGFKLKPEPDPNPRSSDPTRTRAAQLNLKPEPDPNPKSLLFFFTTNSQFF